MNPIYFPGQHDFELLSEKNKDLLFAKDSERNQSLEYKQMVIIAKAQ